MSVDSSLYPKTTTVVSGLSNLFESAESCLSKMSQVSDTIGEDLEGVVAERFEDVPGACCRLANRIPADGAEIVNAILELALSAEDFMCDKDFDFFVCCGLLFFRYGFFWYPLSENDWLLQGIFIASNCFYARIQCVSSLSKLLYGFRVVQGIVWYCYSKCENAGTASAFAGVHDVDARPS